MIMKLIILTKRKRKRNGKVSKVSMEVLSLGISFSKTLLRILFLFQFCLFVYSAPFPYSIASFVGTGSQDTSGDGGKATSALLAGVCSIFVSSTGTTYITDCNSRIRSVDTSDIIYTYGGNAVASTGGDGGPISSASFSGVFGVWGDSTGRLFASDKTDHVCRVVSAVGIITKYTGSVGSASSLGDGGQATAATLNSPRFICGDTVGNLYISEFSAHKIRVIQSSGLISTYAGTGAANSAGDGGSATVASFFSVYGIAASTTGLLYIADSDAQVIRKIDDSSQTIYAYAGAGGLSDFSGYGIPATSTNLLSPAGLCTDTTGSVYYADRSNNRVRVISASQLVYTVAGDGGNTNAGDDGLATAASIASPNSVWADTMGNLLAGSDYSVRKLTALVPSAVPTPMPSVSRPPTVKPTTIKPTAVPSTAYPTTPPVNSPVYYYVTGFAGTGSSGSSTSGPATSSPISGSRNVFADSVGSVYVTDGNSRVYEVFDSYLTRICGTGSFADDGDGGQASSASINHPWGLWGDSLGNVFVASKSGLKIRMISASGIITTYAGTGNTVTAATSPNGDNGQATAATIGATDFLCGDTVGSVYVSDADTNKMRKIASNGIITTVVGNGLTATGSDNVQATSASLIAIEGISISTTGKIYVVDRSYSVVRTKSETTGIISRVAGIGTAAYNGDNRIPTSSALYGPEGVYVETTGAVFVADFGNSRYRMIKSSLIYTTAGSGVSGTTGNEGDATSATFSNPFDVYGDSTGAQYVVGSNSFTIRKLVYYAPTLTPTADPTLSVNPSCAPTAAPTCLPSLIPTGAPSVSFPPTIAPSTGPTVAPTNLPTTTPTLLPSVLPTVQPSVIPSALPTLPPTLPPTTLPSLTPSMVPSKSPSVSPTTLLPSALPTRGPTYAPVAAPMTYAVSVFAGTGETSICGDNGQATSACLAYPVQVVTDSMANVYFAEYGNKRVRKVNTLGIITTIAGVSSVLDSISDESGDGGQATSAVLHETGLVWVDTVGKVFIASHYGASLRVIATNGIISKIFSMNLPNVLWGDSVGFVYMATSDACNLLKISGTTGSSSTVAGTGTCGYANDGMKATSTVIQPSSLFVDTLGNIYFSDSANHRIRKIDQSSSIISTVSGTGFAEYDADGKSMSSSSLNAPNALFIDSVGGLFVVENFVRVRSVLGGSFYTIAGSTVASYSVTAGSAATSATFSSLQSVAANSAGSLYISQYFNAVVLRLTNISPTVSPTVSPSAVPSIAPTAAPTCLPSLIPTGAPSIQSTVMPSTGPTVMPTNLPATAPTLQPSVPPTVPPSLIPSVSPTLLPSLQPTVLPTLSPTGVPSSRGPTCNPSVSPSAAPSVLPTMLPSVGPSLSPSTHPSVGPSAMPSVNPSISPSTLPSIVPSALPSAIPSGLPTISPTASPSLTPSVAPSPTPSVLPSVGPTCSPSVLPTLIPTASPSRTPSVAPTVGPSALPTVLPSVLPSCIPSLLPSIVPTNSPVITVSPTTSAVLPSTGPTMTPSVNPSVNPSVSPSRCPSLAPTLAPSALPSVPPSALPSVPPSAIPSVGPSAGPSVGPSVGPTSLIPSIFPTVFPSVRPSVVPSVSPSAVPSCLPSIVPTVTPTLRPSLVPVNGPSVIPTTIPSPLPSFALTVQPTLYPSAVPTELPSLVPSAVPTVSPSAPPSVISTVHPTVAHVDSTAAPVLSSGPPSLAPSTVPSVVLSMSPSLLPTIEPTTAVSLMPSVSPLSDPSPEPSPVPTMIPSGMPSMLPTTNLLSSDSQRPTPLPSLLLVLSPSLEPTTTPTVQPTLIPSASPSQLPSLSSTLPPSEDPTALPSIYPSQSPSHIPSLLPSVVPSISPSAVPSLDPSLTPSDIPSVIPSLMPSMSPSVMPTGSAAPNLTRRPTAPTLKPSVVPSVRPSAIPVVSPSVKPTQVPSVRPSVKPTRIPSCNPTLKPTVRPTVKPSLIPTTPTIVPTLPRPSISPSPTVEPSISISPSVEPSTPPTQFPSDSPSMPPSTLTPSLKPSLGPTLLPSVSPTTLPSVIPSTLSPTGAPSTLEFYAAHPKATLPSNQTISVIGPADQKFRVVLPFALLAGGPQGDVFKDIILFNNFSVPSYVIPGGSHLPSVVDVSSASAFVNYEGVDSCKRSVSMLGDVNGDSHRDLIIGDPYGSKCYVLFGQADGLRQMTSGFTIFGETEGDLTGWSVADAGDVNNDTLSDIIIGAPNAGRAGAVYVIYGRASNVFDIYLNNLTRSQGFSLSASRYGDYLGIAVSSAGDVNGDRCVDVIASAVMTASYYAGTVYVIYGCLGGVNIRSSQLTVDQGFRVSGVSYSYTGIGVSAAGNVNKDGFDDVLISTGPQKASLIPAVYVVYGGAHVADLDASALTTDQGVRITGGKEAVSYLGDFNGDRFSDIIIDGTLSTSTSANGGLILYSNTAYMTKSTAVPSTQPSLLPSKTPSKAPAAPSRVPTRSPSTVPSLKPTAPTEHPTVGMTEPTSWPSSNPTFPTVKPSAEPTESPSDAPSVEPTESPTCVPSEAPSIAPSFAPTVEPSLHPKVAPTVIPSTSDPTMVQESRAPFSIPTQLPTTQSAGVVYVERFILSGVYVSNETVGGQNYVVNTTETVSIDNSKGNNRYTIVPKPGARLRILHFNASNDLIDLSRFPAYARFSDLNITAGSVIITLTDAQTVRILNLNPADVGSANFLFSHSTQAGEPTKTSDTFSILAGCFIALGGLFLVSMFLLRLCGGVNVFKSANSTFGKQVFLMVIKYNLDGSIISADNSVIGDFMDRLDEEGSSSYYDSFEMSSFGSVPLSMVDSIMMMPSHIAEPSASSWEYGPSQVWDQYETSFHGATFQVTSSAVSQNSSVLSEFSINSDGDFVDKVS